MWIRSELKQRAKAVLKTNYWVAFLVSVVIAIAGGSSLGGGGGSGRGGGSSTAPFSMDLSNDFFIMAILFFLVAAAIAILFSIAFRIFLGYPLEVGGRRYFNQSAQYRDNKRSFRFSFEGGNYLGIVVTMLLKGIYNFLWFLLLIIPGIVKFYAYSMVPFILADNPNIGYNRAIKLSNEMTRGHKFDMFVLDLSFIGWYFLGVLAFGFGVLFVLPYLNATKAELYMVLRQNALDSHLCSREELLLDRG